MFTNGNDSFVDPLGLSSNLSALDGNDTVNAQDGDDTVFGGNGADSLRGGDGLDLLYGDANNDRLLGGNGNDQLFGGSGNDTLNGEANNDTLDGGTGADSMNGGAGNDLIISADGQDTIVTGTGSDTVEYSLSATPRTVTITNFDPAVDKFVLRGEYQPFTVSDTGPPTTVTFANGDVVVFTTIAPTQFAPAYDVVYGNVDVTLITGDSPDLVTLGAAPLGQYVYTMGGNDTVVSAGSPTFVFDLGAGNDSLTVTGLLGGVGGGQLIDMGDGNDTVSLQDVDTIATISLGEGANSLTMKDFGPSYGGNSQSILAGTGNDTIKAGAFNDMYLADLGGDNIITLGDQGKIYAGAWLET
ncbi:MAG: calcium-binding protein, partial [Alphaproteobacteria bacterium]